MSSQLKALTTAYYRLSSLYKNPTRCLRGMAACDQDVELAAQHAELLALFGGFKWGARTEKSDIYFKALALLYEADDYRGAITPSVEQAILNEPTASVEYFNTRRENGDWREANFGDPKVRTLWKAKVLCCVAAIESRRKTSDSGTLLRELNVLEEFVREKLHQLNAARPDANLPSWTTLAFVLTAQARVARQEEDYTYVRAKLLNVIECLDERVAEIIAKLTAHTERLSALRGLDKRTKRNDLEIKELKDAIRRLEDNLVLIRQKHTLTALFNFGLDNLQRGFLDSANHACHAARFLFRLHGHTYHRLFNELLRIAIKRARTSRKKKSVLLSLERELIKEILPHLEPKGTLGNPKLYVYGLRELAVVQRACDKSAEMKATLHKMERITPLGPQWKSRISLLHARAHYVAWQQTAGGVKERRPDQLLTALKYCETAFRHATGGKDGGIEGHADAQSLVDFIKRMGSRNLIDTAESLIAYGTVQLLLKSYFDAAGEKAKIARAVAEALKSAEAVIELSEDDNPRLLAMGHLVEADAYRESSRIVEACRQLEIAKALESRIQHEYVKDRRKAIEEKIPTTLTLNRDDYKHLDQARDQVFGWYIENCPDKNSIFSIATKLKVGPRRVREYIERQGPSSPYYHLLKLDRAKKKPGAKKRIAPAIKKGQVKR